MPVAEFHIRAWQRDEIHAQVLVHSSPAGDIRKPITVPCDVRGLDKARGLFQNTGWFQDPALEQQLVSMGCQLADVLLPRPVYALLTSSLQAIGPDGILRVRLCLDPALIDLPWECLYRPDVARDASLTGFLLFDPRISLVREAPLTAGAPSPLQGKQRMVFAGALFSDGQDQWDHWGVQTEYKKLTEALASAEQFLSLEFVSAAGHNIQLALTQPAAIFHYSGHTDATKSGGYLVREVTTSGRGSLQPVSFNEMYSDELARLLRRARTQLAVFSACNSGRWAFVEPLLRAGLPALIGAQGIVSVQGALTFSQKLYESLAVGLSLDEALAGARFQLLRGGFKGQQSMEWGAFVAYMPATEAVLLPRAQEQSNVTSFQEAARRDSQEAISAVTQRVGPAPQTASAISRTSLRKAIVASFSVEEEALLCTDIREALKNDGVELNLDLDALGGPKRGEEPLVGELIDFLDRRGYLSYLVDAVRRERGRII